MIRFLGGIPFAISLIASTVLFVITGTVLESLADSHQYAATFTYDNPLFTGLLALYFINILVSALRRWPFKRKHGPFLITHLGLLMVLAGVMIKNLFGVQGALVLHEGCGTDQIIVSQTEVLEVENRDTKVKQQVPLSDISVISRMEHSEERWPHWIRDNHLNIIGLPPLPLNQMHSIRLHGPESKPWRLFATESESPEEVAQKLYKEGINLETVCELQLNDPPNLTVSLGSESASCNLKNLSWTNLSSHHIGSTPLAKPLNQEPLVAFINDTKGKTHLYAFDSCGRVHHQSFTSESWDKLIVYDDGYQGYATQATIPFEERMPDYDAITQKERDTLMQILSGATEDLSPPLQLVRNACAKTNTNFAEALTRFLCDWDNSHEWLFSTNKEPFLDALAFSPFEKRAASWIASISTPIVSRISNGETLSSILKMMQWPTEAKTVQELVQQIYAVSDKLPIPSNTLSNAETLSALLRAYGIHYATIKPEIEITSKNCPTLESPTLARFTQKPTLRKMEENRPVIQFRLKDRVYSLRYDPTGQGLRWPTEDGKNLMRFCPKKITIPHRVRLHEATQINYPNSTQPYSYECTAMIGGKKANLSMNQVHETWDGYRFYLAAISPGTDGEVQQVRIVVNQDPAKYLLTYPGAIILALGIILVFWFRKP